MEGHQEPRTLSVMLILEAEAFKAGEGCPSPREGQLSPCLLCTYHLTHSLSSIRWRPPCPQGAAPLSPTPSPAWMEESPAPAPLLPGMPGLAGGSFPPLHPHSLPCPQCPQCSPQNPDTAVPGLTCLTVPAGPWARRAAHSDTSPGMHTQTSCEPLL